MNTADIFQKSISKPVLLDLQYTHITGTLNCVVGCVCILFQAKVVRPAAADDSTAEVEKIIHPSIWENCFSFLLPSLQSPFTHMELQTKTKTTFSYSLCVNTTCPMDRHVAVSYSLWFRDCKSPVSVTWLPPWKHAPRRPLTQLPAETIIATVCCCVLLLHCWHETHPHTFTRCLCSAGLKHESRGCNVPRLVPLLPFSLCPTLWKTRVFNFCSQSFSHSESL